MKQYTTVSIRRIQQTRLKQICIAVCFGLATSLIVARSSTIIILFSGLVFAGLAYLLQAKQKYNLSSYVLLSSLSLMLLALSIKGAGIFDLATLSYPILLIFAAVLGGARLFFTIFSLVLIQSFLVAYLTLTNVIEPNIPFLTWPHLVFIIVILSTMGFSIFILITDMKMLLSSLEQKSNKVQKSRREIRRLARFDSLTNLPNRFYAEKLFNKQLENCQNTNSLLAVFFINLDNFKPINDVLGHQAGDELLIALSARLVEYFSPNKQVIRFGGDEYVVLAVVNDEFREVKELCEQLINSCTKPFDIEGTQVMVSASIGVAIAPRHGTEFNHICRCSDIAMYKAKENGRNTYFIYNDLLDIKSQTNFKLLQSLRIATIQQQFELFYQPIINLKTGSIDAIEALLRWPQSDGTFIPPSRFIPIVERSGLINQIGEWVLEQACEFCAHLRGMGWSDIKVSVNLSAKQFNNGDLQNIIEHALNQSNLNATALEVELTESLLMDDSKKTRQQINNLRRLGVSVAIDDFGTGYSNLRYLHDFNASRLKIDRSFIKTLDDDDDESLVNTIISMADNFNLKTVAEGIENRIVLDKLINMGCDFGQGYLWSKPICATEIETFIRNHQSEIK